MAHSELKQSNKNISHDNLTNIHKGMDEKLLIKCENHIRAYKIVSLLKEHNIPLRQHDESQNPRTGVYGPITGIAIYVFTKDYEKALSMISPLLEEFNDISAFCPKCGSYTVTLIAGNHKYINFLISLCLFLIITPGIYIALSGCFGFKSSCINIIASIMVVLGFILIPFINHYNVNYRCEKCGKKFQR